MWKITTGSKKQSSSRVVLNHSHGCSSLTQSGGALFTQFVLVVTQRLLAVYEIVTEACEKKLRCTFMLFISASLKFLFHLAC